MSQAETIEWHGHRGCRGLLPENSLPAFIKAMDLGMDCLEMDVVISKDDKVVIAHEPYMPADICERPGGVAIHQDDEKSINLFKMDYSEIASFNCGLKHPRFPEQRPQKVHRPLLTELFELAEAHCKTSSRDPVYYTIELKSYGEYDNIYHPVPQRFAQLVVDEIERATLQNRTVLQSFDFRVLRSIREMTTDIAISMLITDPFDLDESIEQLGFTPEIIGPRFDLVDSPLIEACHSKNIRVVPWTVNEVSDMRHLIAIGVDGIITDYPNRKAQIVD